CWARCWHAIRAIICWWRYIIRPCPWAAPGWISITCAMPASSRRGWADTRPAGWCCAAMYTRDSTRSVTASATWRVPPPASSSSPCRTSSPWIIPPPAGAPSACIRTAGSAPGYGGCPPTVSCPTSVPGDINHGDPALPARLQFVSQLHQGPADARAPGPAPARHRAGVPPAGGDPGGGLEPDSGDLRRAGRPLRGGGQLPRWLLGHPGGPAVRGARGGDQPGGQSSYIARRLAGRTAQSLYRRALCP